MSASDPTREPEYQNWKNSRGGKVKPAPSLTKEDEEIIRARQAEEAAYKLRMMKEDMKRRGVILPLETVGPDATEDELVEARKRAVLREIIKMQQMGVQDTSKPLPPKK